MKTIMRAIRYCVDDAHHIIDTIIRDDPVLNCLKQMVLTAFHGTPLLCLSLVAARYGRGRKITAVTLPFWVMLWKYVNRPVTPRPIADEFHGDSDDIAQLLLDNEGFSEDELPRGITSGVASLVVGTNDEFRVKQLHSGKRRRYQTALVAEAKVRFGTPTDNQANRLTVRRFLTTRMEAHGLRVTHINQSIDLLVEAVMILSDREKYARSMVGRRVICEGGV